LFICRRQGVIHPCRDFSFQLGPEGVYRHLRFLLVGVHRGLILTIITLSAFLSAFGSS
jgi:hypothetical protein